MTLDDVAKHVESKEPLMLFLDRLGDVDGVTLKSPEVDEWEVEGEGVHLALLEGAERSSKPYFQICTVVNGLIQNRSGDVIDLDEVPAAFKAAEEERTRFYSEREEEYGQSAWPRAS